jgi:Kef-type K+ transport system membrane component KefB
MADGGFILLTLGILLSAGFVAGYLAEKIGLPRVAAYVGVGALFSEALLGRYLPTRPKQWDPLLIEAALGVVAFLVGGELHLRRLRKLGKTVLAGVGGQSAGAFLLVAGAVAIYGSLAGVSEALAAAWVLGGIAVATAPAATIAVIEEYHAKGPLTETLLGIVAIDDAMSILLFTAVVSLLGQGALGHQLLGAVWEICGAVAAGALAGALLGWFGRRVTGEDLRLPIALGAVLGVLGVAHWLELSTLLSCMVLGLVSKQTFGAEKSQQWLRPMNHIQEVIFLLLFTLAGTHFELAVFAHAWRVILLYMAARALGKCVGAWGFTRMVRGEPMVSRNLGLGLLPQAGVGIGLALIAAGTPGLQYIGPLVVNTLLGTTLVFELTGPIFTKLALARAGEIRN